MQTHGPYADNRYGDAQEVKLLSDSNHQQILETYGQGIYDADQSLKQLYDYLKTTDEKTIVIFYGEHLPVLGEKFEVYKEHGYINNNKKNRRAIEVIFSTFFNMVKF